MHPRRAAAESSTNYSISIRTMIAILIAYQHMGFSTVTPSWYPPASAQSSSAPQASNPESEPKTEAQPPPKPSSTDREPANIRPYWQWGTMMEPSAELPAMKSVGFIKMSSKGSIVVFQPPGGGNEGRIRLYFSPAVTSRPHGLQEKLDSTRLPGYMSSLYRSYGWTLSWFASEKNQQKEIQAGPIPSPLYLISIDGIIPYVTIFQLCLLNTMVNANRECLIVARISLEIVS
ncbi:hypothetical protein C8J56DRAFT_898528 [Mycena floridula]|nr:hypothetical protein C8J56DRAFT_898528 [Mycena floridula]